MYPEYQDTVAFWAIGVDPTESLEVLQEYKEEQGYSWPVGSVAPSMLSDYRVIRQATKVAVNGSGVITFRAGYGVESLDTWQQVFRQLASQ